jgi:uncharacterized protein with GYD domain
MQNPQDRLEAVRAPIEKLGGKIHSSFFAFGAFDVLAITEFLDNISAAAISIAFAAGGAVANVQTTLLLTAAQTVEALRKAGSCAYRSITADSASGTSRRSLVCPRGRSILAHGATAGPDRISGHLASTCDHTACPARQRMLLLLTYLLLDHESRPGA